MMEVDAKVDAVSRPDDDSTNWNRSFRQLTLFFALTVGTVALLATIRQGIVYWEFYHPSSDALVVNVAGRQRMLSQRISKAALEYQHRPTEERQVHLDEFQNYFQQWVNAHRALTERNNDLNLSGVNSREVRALFGQLQPHFDRMRQAGQQLINLAESNAQSGDPRLLEITATLLEEEDSYLVGMETIVHQYDMEARSRVATLIWTDMVVYLIILTLLGAEGWFVLRPAMVRLRQEINHRTKTEHALRAAMEEAQAATRAKSEFLANTSHEIRTPMTAILGFTDVLLNDNVVVRDLPQERLRDLETIRRNGAHLLEIINDILDISKIEANKMLLERLSCQLDDLIADIDSLMGIRARCKSLEFKVELEGSLPETVQTDPTRLKQILMNLISNAIKFTDQGMVRLVVRMDPHESHRLRFEITDSGIGMTEAQLHTLFQPFMQADTSTTRKYGGTGLGLALSKRLANLLGGDITVKSEPGKGSEFVVSIPITADDAKSMAERSGSYLLSPKQDLHAQPRVDLQGVRILLAEDGPDNQRLIVHLLRSVGASVTVADNGQLAVDEAMSAAGRHDPFDVILMDMQMPVMDGYSATRFLRQQGYQRPIVALTAHAMSGDREQCLNAGCDSFATKPIQKIAFYSTIEAMLEQLRSAQTVDP